MFSNNAKLLSLTLVTALAFSSCGKKKELSGGEAPAPASTPATGGNETDPNKKNNPTPDNSTVDVLPPLPPLPGGQQADDDMLPAEPVSPSTKKPNTPPTVKPNTPPPSVPKTVVSTPNSPAAKEEFKPGVNKNTTGMKTEKSLIYTSGGNDQTLEYFKNLNKRQNPQQQQMNAKKAMEISYAELSVDEETQDVSILVKMENGQKYKLAGSPEGDGMSVLGNIRSESTGVLMVSGFHKCIDTDGGCDTSYTKLKFSDGSYARIIFRNARSNYKFLLPKQDGDDSNAHVLLEAFILNGVEKADTSHKLSKIVVSSYEVVNGRSGVDVEMVGDDGNLIKFSGPLAAPEAGSVVNVVMTQKMQLAGSRDLMKEYDVIFQHAKAITEVRMIRNNGLGQTRYALRTQRNKEGKSKVIEMTLSPLPAAVISPNEIASFENTIK